MEQIDSLTAKIKNGHVTIHMTFQLNLDDDYSLLASEIVDASIEVKTKEFQEFLDSCIGEYVLNADNHSITFTDNQDFVKYLLIIDDIKI